MVVDNIKTLTIKDVAGRLETFHDVKLQDMDILGARFWAIGDGQTILHYYNPANIIFIEMK